MSTRPTAEIGVDLRAAFGWSQIGPEAADRLAELDAERAEWEKRARGLLELIKQHNQGLDTRHPAERAFLDASIAVWREIDSIYATGTYTGIGGSTALRVTEREAWEAFKRVLDGIA